MLIQKFKTSPKETDVNIIAPQPRETYLSSLRSNTKRAEDALKRNDYVWEHLKLRAFPEDIKIINYDSIESSIFDIKIKNNSRKSKKFTIEPPKLNCFRLNNDEECYRLAPGMELSISLIFENQKLNKDILKKGSTFEDVIRIEHQDGSFCIPITAYPRVSRLVFPENISFGEIVGNLSENAIKMIDISNTEKLLVKINLIYNKSIPLIFPSDVIELGPIGSSTSACKIKCELNSAKISGNILIILRKFQI